MRDLNTLPLPDLFAELTRDGVALRTIKIARTEDLGEPTMDVTSESLIAEDAVGQGAYVMRTSGVIAGLAALPMARDLFAPDCEIALGANDGDAVTAGATLARLAGPMRQILAMERASLNLLGRLCGIATLTCQYVAEAQRGRPDSPPKVCDTRKTTPGLRAFEKYAVRCGGGWLHRSSLADAMLIKDNHLRALGEGAGVGDVFATLVAPIRAARRAHDLRFVEVEVDTLEQLNGALRLDPELVDIILLDNMPPATLQNAVALRDEKAPTVLLEASGGVSLDTIAAIAATGVDRISVGALTHGATSLDIGLDLD